MLNSLGARSEFNQLSEIFTQNFMILFLTLLPFYSVVFYTNFHDVETKIKWFIHYISINKRLINVMIMLLGVIAIMLGYSYISNTMHHATGSHTPSDSLMFLQALKEIENAGWFLIILGKVLLLNYIKFLFFQERK
jgi:hypothetical protein